jgi:hypothetical protein
MGASGCAGILMRNIRAFFFYPFNGPSGETLTRMGHPGAPIHDHHRSVWWAHAKVDGENYWGGETKARIRQKLWLAYADGDERWLVQRRGQGNHGAGNGRRIGFP